MKKRLRLESCGILLSTLSPESLSAVREWMKQLPTQGIESVDCGSSLLDAPEVAAIEDAVKRAQVRGHHAFKLCDKHNHCRDALSSSDILLLLLLLLLS